MRVRLFSVVLAAILLFSVQWTRSHAATLDYNAATDMWTITGFENTGTGDFNNPGFGLAGNGPHTRFGGGMLASWNYTRGGWLRHTGTGHFTDYWHDTTFSYTVTGATWSNTNFDTSDGAFSLRGSTGLSLASAIADGTVLNGVFSYTASSTISNAYLQYTPNSVSAVPLPAAVWLMLSALGGMGVLGWRRKRTATA